MEPTRVRIRGVNVYEDLDLDLSGLPEGLIAIAGNNGGGKTTLMEAMLPAPLTLAFPSRAGALYRRVKPGTRDNVLETTIRHKGADYRLHVKIDAGTGRSGARIDAYLYRNGEPVPGTEKGDQGAYQEAVDAIFPAPSLLLASAFSCQTGAGDILRMKREERRALFARLLSLGDLEDLADRAAGRRKYVDKLIGEADAALQDLEAEVGRVAGVETELEEAITAVREAEARLKSREKERKQVADGAAARRAEADRIRGEHDRHLGALRRAEEDVRARTSTITDLRLRQEVLQQQEQRLPAARAAAAGLEEARALLGARREAKTALGAEWRAADARVKAAEAAIAAAPTRSTESYEEALREAEAAHAAAVAGAALLPAAEEALRTAAAGLQEARRAEREAGDPERALDRARTALEHLRTTAALLDRVPCGGAVLERVHVETCDGVPVEVETIDCATCGLLAAAVKARAEIPAAEAALPAAEEAVLRLVQLRALTEEAVSAEAAARVARDEASRHARAVPVAARALESARESRDGAATRRTAAEAATADLAAALAERSRVSAAGETAAAEIAEQEAVVRDLEAAEAKVRKMEVDLAGLPELRRSLRTEGEGLHRAQEALEETRRAAPPSPEAAEAAAQTAARDLVPYTENVARATEALTAARATQDRLQGRLEELRVRQARYQAATARRAALATRRAAFALLERGYGREGIQALEIDAAGPRVSALANELLGATFNGRFSIRLVTTRPSADGKKLNEVFDVEVPDGLYGVARTPEDLSGGERVIISEAIKLAIAIYNAERNGIVSDTLWRDECDGALDEESAAAYAPMLRRALALGGFRRCYFISHRQDVIAQADAVLRCGGGQVEVEVR